MEKALRLKPGPIDPILETGDKPALFGNFSTFLALGDPNAPTASKDNPSKK
jgi:hypothetical protein